MTRRPDLSLTLLAALCLGTGLAAAAGPVDFDFAASTPVGSWQERETVSTVDGKEAVSVFRVKYLGDEERNGQTYAWVETEIRGFKVKKGERKPLGDPTYVKMLLKKSLLEGDVVNSIGNFSDLATEIIMQTGDAQPMRLGDAGGMLGGMAQAIGLQMTYQLDRDGDETVSTPAGDFGCARYRGRGTATMNLVIKQVKVESTTTHWLSDEVPFGIVKLVSDSLVNGKADHSEATVTAFGRSGATSMIRGEPQEMPSLGNMFGG